MNLDAKKLPLEIGFDSSKHLIDPIGYVTEVFSKHVNMLRLLSIQSSGHLVGPFPWKKLFSLALP